MIYFVNTMMSFIKNLFKQQLSASTLNNKRRQGNAHYDDVCM